MNMATLRMECFAPNALDRLVLQSAEGPVELPVDGQHVRVPYPVVRRAMEQGWAPADPGIAWPPRRGDMCRPKELSAGDAVALPDGTCIEISAPFNQALEIPERFIPHFERLGWVRLAAFA